ncbi:putative baseplate assembly protein [Rhodothermaceae bacterium RA]|nr:putative baseplate assembly protein [Rhodothermaceae bacterium RA]
MPLHEPTLDDRSYQQILNEALARIPVHNPEWTNHNDSDPGVTLLQVFSFMTESLLYRANRMPERNRIKFLRLLGLPMQAAASARGLVTFEHLKGPLRVEPLAPDLEVLAGSVPFRTVDGLYALPIEARAYYKADPALTEAERRDTEALYRQLYASYETADDVQLRLYVTRMLEPPAPGAVPPVLDLQNDPIDGALWVALLARTPDLVETTRALIAHSVLTLGIVPALEATARTLPPGGATDAGLTPPLIYERPVATDATARYAALEARPFGNVLEEPNIVELTLPGAADLRTWSGQDPLEDGVGNFPPSLEDSDVAARLITWIRIRPGDARGTTRSRLSARLSYVGINAARVVQEARVTNEIAGEGTGEPDQVVALVNTPVIPDSVRLTVNGEPWTRIDDLAAAGPEVPRRNPRWTPGVQPGPADAASAKVYTLDRESGEIRFGDGLRGARPPRGSLIQASYAYGGGREGQVGIGALSKSAALPSGLRVTNPVPTWGGDEAETVEDAEKRIPGFLQHRDRLVTEADFREITLRTPGVDVGRVEVLPLFHPEAAPAEGVVTVLVIPKYDPLHPTTPEPDRLFLNTVCAHLNPRRLLTTEVHVHGPVYVPVYVSVGIDVLPGRDAASVREAVREGLRAFLSPFTGGFEGAGWPLSHDVEQAELFAVATRVAGVARVNALLLGDAGGSPQARVPIHDLDLPRLVAVAVQSGDPQPLGELVGTATAPGDDGTGGPRIVPVPIVPDTC